ncbi:MAG: hypothetical protein H6739_20790 [Alphaproteobacteria bacterium]|nr:hypothetical protein [Alphaproteobacteria bacterium]
MRIPLLLAALLGAPDALAKAPTPAPLVDGSFTIPSSEPLVSAGPVIDTPTVPSGGGPADVRVAPWVIVGAVAGGVVVTVAFVLCCWWVYPVLWY